MTISIIHPSYGRPELAASTAKTWINRAMQPLEYLLCISYQDPKKYQYEELFKELPVRILYHIIPNMVKQGNYAAYFSTGNLLIQVSDDFDCPEGWDKLLIDALTGKEDFIVKTDDGVKVSGINSDNIIALPILDRKYYERFGHIYHPDYKHFYGDEELSNVGDILGRKITLPILFEHIHYVNGKAKEDDVNRKNNKHFQSDKETFKIRKEKNFGL